jgi:transcriptional regulator with XRE-family HTH domain
MKEFEIQKIKGVLKMLLRKKKITYPDLAKSLQCSVPTVTRILGGEELSLTRLLQLCEILKVDLADIQNLIAESESTEEYFTLEQETFLAKNRGHLSYLLRLFRDETPKQIAEKFRLSQRSTDKYLIALERLGLIKVSAKQKVKPVFKTLPAFGKGPLARAFYESLIGKTSEFFLERVTSDLAEFNSTSSTTSKFSVSIVKVTPATSQQWFSEIESVCRSYSKRASFEENTRDVSELRTVVVSTAHAVVPTSTGALQKLDQLFGDVTNL